MSGLYEGDWPDVLARVAQLAAEDGLRLVIGEDDDGQPTIMITDQSGAGS